MLIHAALHTSATMRSARSVAALELPAPSAYASAGDAAVVVPVIPDPPIDTRRSRRRPRVTDSQAQGGDIGRPDARTGRARLPDPQAGISEPRHNGGCAPGFVQSLTTALGAASSHGMPTGRRRDADGPSKFELAGADQCSHAGVCASHQRPRPQ